MPSGASAKRLVADGYDQIAAKYLEWRKRSPKEYMIAHLDCLTEGLRDGDRVLDLGCGSGHPYGSYLSERFDVVGVDISPGQLKLGRELDSGPALLLADMARLPLRHGAFGAITALYSVIHVPREQHEELWADLHALLRPEGRLFVVLGTTDWVGTESDWLVPGVDMYWSQFDSDTSCRMLEDAGFHILTTELIPDPLGDGGIHLYVVAART
ncbi:MAG: class I SAM-dependent methyltransferase [Chloroflexi bacterium]|nr:class I SAM-dependent methyltransferase [Chloroflexota bacterium]